MRLLVLLALGVATSANLISSSICDQCCTSASSCNHFLQCCNPRRNSSDEPHCCSAKEACLQQDDQLHVEVSHSLANTNTNSGPLAELWSMLCVRLQLQPCPTVLQS